MTSIAAKLNACRPDAHIRFTLVPGTDSGNPAISGARRAMFRPCSSIWVTHRSTTSSTICGSTPVRSASARRTTAARSPGRQSFREPPRLPIGVRTAPTITASDTGLLRGRPWDAYDKKIGQCVTGSGSSQGFFVPQADGVDGGILVRLAAIVLVLGLALSVLGGGPAPSASIIHPKPASYDIREDFDLVHVGDFAGMSCGAFASQSDSNGFVHYAYVSHGNLFYGVEGLAGNPAIVSAGTGGSPPIPPAPSTDQRVLTFQMDLDSVGTIHVAYDRMTVAAWPYDPVLYYAKSPAWQEVPVSSAGVWTRPSLAVDSGNHAHVAWSYTGNIENVWYATDVNGWTNLQVDQNQSSNYWDDRMNPSLAIDMSGAVHVIWEDYRNSDPSGPTPGQVEIWHASSANGWVNSELVLPDDAAPARFKHYPVLTIDSTNRSHVVWMEWNDNGNLYYANSTDWNRAIKITNASTSLGYAEQLPSHPVEVRNGRLTVVYSDARSGTPALWRKDDWDLGPDVTPPIAGPLANRTIGRVTGGRLQAAGSWDNDRIASYDWRFTGPSTVVASGYDVAVNLALTGRYAGILEVRDPAGFSATTNFTLDVIPEASTTGWILDRPLSSVPGCNNWVTRFPLART